MRTSATVVGVQGSDAVSLSTVGAAGTFASANVGTGIGVSITGVTIGGAAVTAGDYTLTQPSTTANITTKAVTVAGITIFVAPSALSQLATTTFSLSSNFILVVVPMFVLMGEVLAATGIGATMFRATELWFRRLPGALAIATIWACAGFGSVCGWGAHTPRG